MKDELEHFNDVWEREAAKTIQLHCRATDMTFVPIRKVVPSASWPGISPKPRRTEVSVSSAEDSREMPGRQGSSDREKSRSWRQDSSAFIAMRLRG